MNGDCARRARRRAISVLPTPVAPNHQDVLRRDISAMSGAQPLPAIAVAQRDRHRALRVRLPTTYLSSSATMSRGVSEAASDAVVSGR
jgi:hypothetical protein